MPYIRESQADIRFSLEGVPYGDSWFSWEGANLTAEIAKTRPGGMGDEVAVGGDPSRDDVTITIQFSDIVAGWHKLFESMVGWGEAHVSLNFLGPNKVPLGITQTNIGVLGAATLPNFAGDGGGNQAFYTVVVALDEKGS